MRAPPLVNETSSASRAGFARSTGGSCDTGSKRGGSAGAEDAHTHSSAAKPKVRARRITRRSVSRARAGAAPREQQLRREVERQTPGGVPEALRDEALARDREVRGHEAERAERRGDRSADGHRAERQRAHRAD